MNEHSDDDRRRLLREEDEREKNRREVMERKRQWEVVDSDEDEDRRRSRSRSAGDEASRDRRRRGRHSRHKKDRSRSRSSSSSGSRARDRSRPKKDRKKHQRRSKDRKRRRQKRHKESKKHAKKAHRRAEHDDADSYSSSSLSENEREILEKNTAQNAHAAASARGGGHGGGAAVFGKYGIINPSDFYSNTTVKSSFERWLSETKGIPDFNGPKHELMEYFKEYAEDYNTATLPHMKYYNYDKWEVEEYARKKREAEAAAAAQDGGGGGHVALDELRHKEKMAARAKQRRLDDLKVVQYGMTAEKREEMKHQARLRHEMAVAYKTGDEEMRKRLQRRLEIGRAHV